MIRASIEGNIGAGKTTLINQFKNNTTLKIMEEPVHLWTNYNGIDVLKANYHEPNKYAYHLQSLIIKTQTAQHLAMPNLIERSLTSSQNCFTKTLYESQKLTYVEYKMLEQQYRESLVRVELPELIIYLRSNPEELEERIRLRNRPGEDKITLDYLTQLHGKHERWLIDRAYDEHRPILIIEQEESLNPDIYIAVQAYLNDHKIINDYQTVTLH